MPSQHKLSVSELLDSMGITFKVLGVKDRYVSSVSRIEEASRECVTFCNQKGAQGLQMVRNSNASIVICYDDLRFTDDDSNDKTLILVPDPRLAFIRIMQAHFAEGIKPGISPATIVDKKAKIHHSVYIGPNSYIGNCDIGEGTAIHGNVYIYSGTKIGKNVIIQAGAVIGAAGQGFERNETRELERFPQIGGVIIEDDVEISANATIMRGAMGDTIIRQGAKIGNLCNIGHGAVVGKHCLIIAMSMLGGSSRIGDYSQVSLGACVRNKVVIGKNVTVGMGAVVTGNVGDGKTVFGVPAKEQK